MTCALAMVAAMVAAPVAAEAPPQLAQAQQAPVPPRPTVSTQKPSYQPFEPIVVRWDGMMAPMIYVLMRKPDSERSITFHVATGGAAGERYRAGNVQFPGQLPGDYDIEVRAGEERGYLLARNKVTVVDPNQEQQAAPAAQPGGPQPGAATPPGPAAALPAPPALPAAGGRYGLKFTDAPTPVDFAQFGSVLGVVQQGTGKRCTAAGEGLGWNVSVRDDARIRRLYTEAAEGMMGKRYALTQLSLQYPNTYAYRAENTSVAGPDRTLLMAWYFVAAPGSDTGTLYLAICPSE